MLLLLPFFFFNLEVKVIETFLKARVLSFHEMSETNAMSRIY